MSINRQSGPAFYRYAPFAVFMLFIAFDEILGFAGSRGFYRFETTQLYCLYPVKAIVVGGLLYYFRREYEEICFRDLSRVSDSLLAIGIGILVFVLWINMDWTLGSAAAPKGYNPLLFTDGYLRITMILFRVLGAALVVPIMEELFWRSFLIRYIIDKNFDIVPMGAFTWMSFFFTVILFGLEHNYILAGMMAGVFYNLILYRTRSLAHCILAHAVTNLALAVYVLHSGEWRFW